MADFRRLKQIRAYQTPLILEIVAVGKADHMVVNAIPADEGISVRLFDRPLQLHRFAAPRTLKQRNGRLDASFELLLFFPGWTVICAISNIIWVTI